MRAGIVKELINDLTTEMRLLHNEKQRVNIKIRVNKALGHPLNEYAEWVIKKVADKYGFTVEQLKQKNRGANMIVLARYIAMYIINDNTPFKSYSSSFVNRDRTTFYNMLDQIEGLLVFFNHQRRFEQLKDECSISAYNRKDYVNNI